MRHLVSLGINLPDSARYATKNPPQLVLGGLVIQEVTPWEGANHFWHAVYQSQHKDFSQPT